MTDQKNYYDILEIPTNASFDEVQRGYLRAKNAYGQDSLALYSLMSKDECESIMNTIEEAYSILSDPSKRREYDEARGFKTHDNFPLKRKLENVQQKQEATPAPNRESMSQIVAKKRFSLDYTQDQEMEQKIENAEEFTGLFLQEIREYKQVDIKRMSDMTKVSKTYLKNIETEEFDKLPALVYVRGFVYQYAKCLKLNPEVVATSYLRRLKTLKGEI